MTFVPIFADHNSFVLHHWQFTTNEYNNPQHSQTPGKEKQTKGIIHSIDKSILSKKSLNFGFKKMGLESYKLILIVALSVIRFDVSPL